MACAQPGPEHLKGFDYLGLHQYAYEHILRNDEAALSVARYIIKNPVRAGLVARVEDYWHSGSSVYTLEQILEAVQLPENWYRRSAKDGRYV